MEKQKKKKKLGEKPIRDIPTISKIPIEKKHIGDDVLEMRRKNLDLYKIKMHPYTKNPDGPWRDQKYQKKMNDWHYGIPCGEKNNIMIVDLDIYKWKDKDNHIFIKTFGKDFIDKIDTFTVQTGKGGYHLYFKYDPDMMNDKGSRNIISTKYEIDFKSEGGFVLGPGSQIKDIIVKNKEYYPLVNNGLYTIIRDAEIKEMSQDMKDFINIYVFEIGKSVKEIKEKREKIRFIQNTQYKYDITKKQIEKIINKLPMNEDNNKNEVYYKPRDKYLQFTQFCKYLDAYDIWMKYNKMKCSRCRTIDFWNSIKVDTCAVVDHYFKLSKMDHKIIYHKYKPIETNVEKPTTIINREKLEYQDVINDTTKKILFIRSDMGTGKTFSFREYIKKYSEQFISICCRVSLCEEQYRDMSESYIHCQFYKNENKIDENISVLIEIDSIMRIQHFDFKNNVIFMDEFNSILEYLITASTIKNNRIRIFNIFNKMLLEAKKIICSDADISDDCINYVKSLGIDYEFHENTQLHCTGVSAIEITDNDLLIAELKERCNKKLPFIVCCDSRSTCKFIYKQLEDNSIYMIDRDTKNIDSLDDHDRIIMSPKIIMGVSSTQNRPVYAIHKGKTIGPEHMMQQINRCRNIEYLKFMFIGKKILPAKYTCIDDVRNKIKSASDLYLYGDKNIEDSLQFKNYATDAETTLYNETLAKFLYKRDCYNTNKLLHFILLLRKKGFNVVKSFGKNENEKNINYDECVKIDMENFDEKHHNVQYINKYLKVPEKEICNYKEYFCNQILLNHHFNICNYFAKDTRTLVNELSQISDFKINNIERTKNKILFIKKLEKCFDMKKNEEDKHIYLNKNVQKKTANVLQKEYKTLFRNVNVDFTDNKKTLQKLISMYKHIMGDKIIKTVRRWDIKGNPYYYYFDDECIAKHYELLEFRQQSKLIDQEKYKKTKEYCTKNNLFTVSDETIRNMLTKSNNKTIAIKGDYTKDCNEDYTEDLDDDYFDNNKI